MTSTGLKTSFLVIAGKAVVVALCLIIGVLLLSHFSSDSHAAPVVRQESSQEVPTIPTVPTIPPPTPGTATPTPTTTPATPTATPGPAETPVVSPDGKKLTYKVVFTNKTGQIIHGARLEVTVPPYTTFDLAGSTPGWQCPTGITAGNVCHFDFGDIQPDVAVVQAAAVDETREANIVLNVLTDQLPSTVKSINFDVHVLDENNTVFASYPLSVLLPDRPSAQPTRHMNYLPLLHR